MRWKTGILIALICSAIGIVAEYLLIGCITFGGFLNSLKGITGFVVGLLIGLLGGSDLLAFIYNWFQKRKERKETELQAQKETLEQEHNTEQIYNWLYHKTEEYKGRKVEEGVGSRFNTLNDPRFRSTEEIASNVHILSKKVKDLCETNEKLTKMTRVDLIREKAQILDEKYLEKWAITEFVE